MKQTYYEVPKQSDSLQRRDENAYTYDLEADSTDAERRSDLSRSAAEMILCIDDELSGPVAD